MRESTGISHLRLLGRFELVAHPYSVPLRRAEQRLLAALALCGPLSRAAAVGLLWPESTEAKARGSLRTVLWRLAGASPGLVDVGADRLRLCRSVEIDLKAFVRLAMRVIAHEPVTDADLRTRLGVDEGELLPDWYDDWVVFERERLRQLQLHALERAARSLGRQGRHGLAIDLAITAVRLEPLRESAQRTLIELHLAEDNLVEAARQLTAFTGLVRAELGVEPSSRLQETVASALRSRRAAPVDARTIRTEFRTGEQGAS